jgi:multidrug efflux system membrane fusion protein
MASRIFKPSRIVAVLIVLVTAGWIASGVFGESQHAQEPEAPATPEAPPVVPVQKVSVTTSVPEKHQRLIIVSCLTQADHRSIAVARAAGVMDELKVSRGSAVRWGDVVAVLSDEGREAAVKQAEALLEQRRAEYEANKTLIDKGNAPRNTLPALEAAVATAEAALSVAMAEAEKSNVKSPVDGIVDDVPVQLGQAIQVGTEIASIIGPDPMLAVGAVGERQRGSVEIGQTAVMRFINGNTVTGTISFIGLSADKATRTYPVQARMANPDAAIPDGVTCEMSIALDPVEATPIPKSAIVFSDQGEIGVRIADADNKARFVPITVIDDSRDFVWITGIDQPIRVIVVGQEFVKDGDLVDGVAATDDASRAGPPA